MPYLYRRPRQPWADGGPPDDAARGTAETRLRGAGMREGFLDEEGTNQTSKESPGNVDVIIVTTY